MTGHLGTSTGIFKDVHAVQKTSRKTSRTRTPSKSDILAVPVTFALRPIGSARDALRNVFSTCRAYSVTLSRGWTTVRRLSSATLRCRPASTWEATLVKVGTSQRPAGAERGRQAAIDRHLEGWPEHVLVACEEQSSRTTRDPSLQVRTRVPRSFDAGTRPAQTRRSPVPPPPRASSRRDWTSGRLSARDVTGSSLAHWRPLDAFAWPKPRLG